MTRAGLPPAPPDFCLAISYNPGSQSVLKDLQQRPRQRFAAQALVREAEVALARLQGADRRRGAGAHRRHRAPRLHPDGGGDPPPLGPAQPGGGPLNYAVVDAVEKLPYKVSEIYRRLTR